MPELSGSKGRTGPRFSRSRAAMPSGKSLQPTQKSQDFARDTSGVGAASDAAALAGVAGLVGKFVAKEGKERDDHDRVMKDMLEREKIVNQKRNELAAMKAADIDDLQAARDGKGEIAGVDRSRMDTEFGQVNSAIIVGEHMAKEHLTSPEFLGGLNTSQDPHGFVDDYATKVTKDMDPLLAASVKDRLTQDSLKMATSRALAAQEEAVEVPLQMIKQNQAASPPKNLEDAQDQMSQISAITATLGPERMAEELQTYVYDLATRAADGDPVAQNILDAPDDDGLSLTQKYDKTVEKANQDYINNVDKVETPRDATTINDSLEQLAQGDPTAALTTLMSGLDSNPDFFKSAAARGALAQIQGSLEGAAMQNTYFESIHAGEYTNIPIKDQRSMSEATVRGLIPYLVNEKGYTPEDAMAKFAEFVSVASLNDNAKGAVTQILRDSKDGRLMFEALIGAGDGALRGLTSEGKEMFAFMKVFGWQEGLNSFNEARLGSKGNVPLKDILNAGGVTDVRQMNIDGINAAIDASGISAGKDTTVGIELPFDTLDAEDEGEVAPEVFHRNEELTRVYAKKFPGQPISVIQEMVKQHLAPELTTVWDEATGYSVVLKPAGSDTYNSGNQADLAERVENAGSREYSADLNGGRVGGRAGGAASDASRKKVVRLEDDIYTGANGGRQIWTENEQGVRQEEVYELGIPVLINPDAPAFSGWERVEGVEDQDGLVWAYPPETDMTVGQGKTGMAWINRDGFARLRDIGPDPEAEAQIKVDERRKGMNSGQDGSDRGKTIENRRKGIKRGQHLKQKKDLVSLGKLDYLAENDFMVNNSDNAAEVTDQYQAAVRDTDARAIYLTDLDSKQGREFAVKYDEFLDIVEGEDAALVYDDATGKTLNPGQQPKGKRTIARGYNLERGDWNELSARIGMNRDEARAVYNGEKALTAPQRNALNRIIMKDTADAVYKRYRPENGFPPLPREFYVARMSLWHHGVRETKDMDAAIKAGDWDRVAVEIIDRSMKGFRGTRWEKGVFKRRLREAALATGGRSTDERIKGLDPYKR